MPADACPAGPARRPGVSSAGLWNIANELTMLRLLLVPVFVVVCCSPTAGIDTGWRWAAFGAFAVASVTDLRRR